jgi:hypothetical protein
MLFTSVLMNTVKIVVFISLSLSLSLSFSSPLPKNRPIKVIMGNIQQNNIPKTNISHI